LEILVRVSKERICAASLDWEEDTPEGHWLLSFGNIGSPNTDVEIEFTEMQLGKLKETVNSASKPKHLGGC
jgi:hypothetical protein